MDILDRIRDICYKNGMPISHLEKACGFSNGYIRNLKKGTMPMAKLEKVSEVLDVPVDYLMYGDDGSRYYNNDDVAAIAQEIHDNRELRGLFSAAKDVSPETLSVVHQMLLKLKQAETEG